MIKIAALLLALAPQDPDRSTPEKAALSFLGSQDEAAMMQAYFKVLVEISELGSFARTPELNTRVKEEMSRFKEWVNGSRPSPKFVVRGQSELTGGDVAVDLEEETKEGARPLRIQLRRVEGQWRIAARFRGCGECRGSGACGACRGKADTCKRCGGGKTCPSCKGGKLVKAHEEGVDVLFFVPQEKLDFPNDLSTPESAAKTVLGIRIRAMRDASDRFLKFMDEHLARLRVFFVEEEVKKLEVAREQAIEKAKKEYAALRPKLVSVEQKGDVAYAVLSMRSDFMVNAWGLTGGSKGDPSEVRVRVVLKKAGGKWLEDDEQHRCYACGGKAKDCKTCEGSGYSGPPR